MGIANAIIWIGIAIIAGGFAIAMFSMAGMVGKAEKAAQANASRMRAAVQANEIEGKRAEEVGERLRTVALVRQKADLVPDAESQFERTLMIDSISLKMKQLGVDLPDSYRTLLNYLTLDELQEALEFAK
jgi:hypothetical protein